VPLGLYTGELDPLGDKADEAILYNEVKNTVAFYRQYTEFDHSTFTMSIDKDWIVGDVIGMI
jgi:hypothetical protein